MIRSVVAVFVKVAALSGVVFLAGCSSEKESESSSFVNAGGPSPSTEAVTKAASDFLDAVLKGDTQRASSRLTPQAMQRIIASGKQFAPPGLETATFRIGEVRTPATDKAFVHCILTDSSTGAAHSEEMCCLMRLVDNDWRVSGIAYWDKNQVGTMSDFETGQSTPIPGGQLPNTAGPGGGQPAGPNTPTVPPRMAQEPTAPSPY